MKERLSLRIKRHIKEIQKRLVKWIIRKSVQKLDDLGYGGFMAYSWGRGEITDYNVLAERSYKDMHIYGTRVDRLINGEWVSE